MGLNWPSLDRLSITTRLMFWFLVISLIPCSLLTLVYNYLSVRSLERSVRSQLASISAAKTTELDDFIRECRANIVVRSQTPRTIQTTEDLQGPLTESARLQKQKEFESTALIVIEAYEYSNLYLFGADSRLLYRTKSDLNVGEKLLTGPLKGTELAEVFERSKMLLQSEVSDYQFYPGLTEPAIFIAHPVLKEGAVIGVIMLQIGNSKIFRVFGDSDGLGETGETLVASRKGDQLVFVSPLRHIQAAAFHTTVRMGEARSTAMQRAVKGERGYGQSVDYRAEPVVSVWSYVPAFRWGMQVKQDRTEAYAVIDRQRLAAALLLALTVASVAWVAWWVARSISRPIREAALVADRVAAGDLTATCMGKAPGEAGLLLQAIRKMTTDLRLADRPGPAIERRAHVHGYRDFSHVQAARADGLRLRYLDQRGRGRRQRDLGHQPGTTADHERGQPARQTDHSDGRDRAGESGWDG